MSGWSYFPINFVWAATLVPGAIILDVILLWSRSFLITAVVGGLSFGHIFYPGNWSMLAVFHQPVEYNGMLMSIADIQGYHYVRTDTLEHIRFVEKGTQGTFGMDVVWPASALFSGFICVLIYFIWHFFGRWYSTTRFLEYLDGEQESVWEDSLKSVPMDVHSPLGEKAAEHSSGRVEDVMHIDKYIQRLSGAVVAIVALLVLAGFIRLSIFNMEYLFLILAMAGAGVWLSLHSRLH